MKFSHKFLQITTFLFCAFISQQVYGAPVQINSDSTDVAIQEKITPDPVNTDITLKKSEDTISTTTKETTLTDTIDIHVDASTPNPSDITIDDSTPHPPYDDHEEDELPGWLDMYVQYIIWLWSIATWITTLIVTNVLPVLFFIAACLLTAEILVLFVRGITECLGMSAVIVVGPTERTRLL